VRVIERVRQKRDRIDAGVLGQGKRMEIARLTGGSGIVARGPQAQRKKVDTEADDAMAEYFGEHGEPEELQEPLRR